MTMREKSILDLKRKIINKILKHITATESNTYFDFEKDVSFMTHPRTVGKLVLKITMKNIIDPYEGEFYSSNKFIVVNYDTGLENEKEVIVNDAINLIYNILNVERTKVWE